MVRFTPAQQSAITAPNRELLVSAAAGSGKTAVLVERILHCVSCFHQSLDRMLIVTFTRAAAAEMRERLELRLSEAALENPALHKQLELVPTAQISTLHAFCQRVVRENFQLCGVDPQFSVSDDREQAILYEESLDASLNRLYDDATTDPELAALIAKYNEREITLMLSILYKFLISRPDPMDWLGAQAGKEWTIETLNDDPLALSLCAEGALILAGMRALWEQSRALSQSPDFPPPYVRVIENDHIVMDALENEGQRLTGLLTALHSLRFMTLPRFTPDSDASAALAAEYKRLRSEYKDLADELAKLLPADCERAVCDLRAMSPATRGLAKFCRAFHDDYTARKRERGSLDFSDLEHMALFALSSPGYELSARARFDAVFVDEYQDISALQEALLNALKRGENVGAPQRYFYVGDVKQSIYRFRLAQPSLFLHKLNTFSPNEGAPQRKIILNRNFRSREGVLDAVNRVFSRLMDSRVTEIDYDEDARLIPGVPSMGDPAPELHVLCSDGLSPADAVLAQASLIARDIQQTVGTPILDASGEEAGALNYRDIAVLLPVSKNVADKVELVLQREGIPVYCENAADSLQSEEITQVVSHLRLLDNLMNDIALISELRGPLFEMTEPELARIRLRKPEKEASFLEALRLAAKEAPDEALRKRCADALSMLEQERFLFNSMPADAYLWDFINRTGLYAHYGAQPGGKLRQANLRLLCHQLGEYALTHAGGLGGFLDTVSLENVGGGVSPAVINPWEDVVRVMTIHKSKGLEFPTVYVMGLGGSIRRRQTTRALCVHGKLGYALGYVNEQTRTKRQTVLQSAIALRERAEERAERARLLYVAMTRAKNRLVLLGAAASRELSYERTREALDGGVFQKGKAYAVRSAKSMLEWLMQCAQPVDLLELWGRDGLSTEHLWESATGEEKSTKPTSFPQEKGSWRIVFHMEPEISMRSQTGKKVKNDFSLISKIFVEKTLPDNEKKGAPDTRNKGPFATGGQSDPLSPLRPLPSPPLKLGVTALCRLLAERETGRDALYERDGETAEDKRYPFGFVRPRLLADLPTLPAFLQPAQEERALQTGVQTHKLLGLVALQGVRAAGGDLAALKRWLRAELERLTARGVFTPTDAALCDVGMAAGFFLSDLGGRMLRSQTVHREWSFNLRVREPFDTLVQGVIDLCFLENDAWVLVDYKTDRVQTPEELWPRYEAQMGFYADALARATPYAVSQRALFSLRLGCASVKM